MNLAAEQTSRDRTVRHVFCNLHHQEDQPPPSLTLTLSKSVLWILLGYNADLDPAFYLNTLPDPGSQTNADLNPDPGQTLKSQKVEFLHEKYTKSRCWVKKSYLLRYKSLLERQETRFMCKFWSISMRWIRIWIPIHNTNPGFRIAK